MLFVSTSVMVAPFCNELLSPPILALAVVNQEKVVPATLLVKVTPAVTPEQIVCGLGVAVAIGDALTVIFAENVTTHPAPFEVVRITEYVPAFE